MKKVHLWKNWETNAESRGKAAEKPFSSGKGTNVSYVVTEKEWKRGKNEFLKDLMSPEQRLPQVTSAFSQ